MMPRRVLFLTCSLLLGLALAPRCLVDDPSAKPLIPEEAAKHPREKGTVRMEVKSVFGGGRQCQLNSEEDPRSDKNFGLFLAGKVYAKLQAGSVPE